MADDNENFMDWAKPAESEADKRGKIAATFLRELCKAIDEAEKSFLKVFYVKKEEIKEFSNIETSRKLINVSWSQVEFQIVDNDSIDYLEFRVEITDQSGIRVRFPGANTSGTIIMNGAFKKIQHDEYLEYKIVGKNFEVSAVIFE